MTRSGAPRAKPERVLLAAGTASYDNQGAFATLDKVPLSLATVVRALSRFGAQPSSSDTADEVRKCLARLNLDAGAAVLDPPGYLLNPDLDALKERLEEAARAAPIVIVYYTGHGMNRDGEPHFVITHESDPDRLMDSALRTSDLPFRLTVRGSGEVDPVQPEVLLILDCCYAGAAGEEMLANALSGLANQKIWVLASASRTGFATQGAFAKALAQALQEANIGSLTSHIPLMTLLDRIRVHMPKGADQRAEVFPPGGRFSGTPHFFPNPDYHPEVAGLSIEDQTHWLSRVRGGPDETAHGYYLTGRTGRIQAARDLTNWITDPVRGGLAVVTGSPGTGKSTLLALPALLTTARGRDALLSHGVDGDIAVVAASLLPVDAPVVAIHARGLTTDQVALRVADELGRTADTTTSLLEDLDNTPTGTRPIVVIVDAIDEASGPETLVSSFLVPLSRLPAIKVVLGARRHILGVARDAELVIDLDAKQYQDPTALTEYIQQVLVAAREPEIETPYGKSPGSAMEIAAALGRRATTLLPNSRKAESFLLGRLLAVAVRGRTDAVSTANPDWLDRLPDSVGSAFDEDLAQLGPKAPLARSLLAALAWARGSGLPWEGLWVPVSRALSEWSGYAGPVVDDDVRWLMRKAGAYVVEDHGLGARSVFRPFHDLLAVHLRNHPTEETGDPGATAACLERQRLVEASITTALLTTVPTDVEGEQLWELAHPYVRSHLAEHAHAAGPNVFHQLLSNADFLAVADPATLLPLLPLGEDPATDVARVYRRARPALGDDPQFNAAAIQEAAAAVGTATTQALFTGARIPAAYRTILAAVAPDESILTLTGHTGEVVFVAFGTGADERTLLASSQKEGTVRLWDPTTGAPVGRPLTGHAHGATLVAFGTGADGRALVTTGGRDGVVRVWDPTTGASVGTPSPKCPGGVRSLALLVTASGRTLAASAGQNGQVRLWDPIAGSSVGQRRTKYATGDTLGNFAPVKGQRSLLASASYDGVVGLWDPVTGLPVFLPQSDASARTTPVTRCVTISGWELVASASHDGTTRLWDPTNGEQVRHSLTGYPSGASAFWTGADGQTHVASAMQDGAIQLWNLTSGAPLGRLSTGNHRKDPLLAVGTGEGRCVLLASASHDATMQMWDLSSGLPTGHVQTLGTGGVRSVAFGTGADGRPLVATAGHDGALRLWDPTVGKPVGDPLTGHSSAVTSVAFGVSPDQRALLASASFDGTVRLWDPSPGPQSGRTRTVGAIGRVTSVAFGILADGRALLASVGELGNVRLWDPTTGASVGPDIPGHRGQAMVAFNKSADGPLLLASAGQDGMMRVWNPATSQSVEQNLTHSNHRFANPPTGMPKVASLVFCTATDGLALLASAGDDGTVQLWDATTCAPIMQRRTSHGSAVLGTDANGCLLDATARDDGTVDVSEAPTFGTRGGTYLATSWHNDRSTAVVAFGTGPDGSALLATAGIDGTVRVWNPITGEAVWRPLTGHVGRVASVAFGVDADGRMLVASAGQDGTVRVWDPTTGESIVLRRRRAANAIALCPGTSLLAIADDEGLAILDIGTRNAGMTAQTSE